MLEGSWLGILNTVVNSGLWPRSQNPFSCVPTTAAMKRNRTALDEPGAHTPGETSRSRRQAGHQYDRLMALHKVDLYQVPVCHTTTSTLNVHCCVQCGVYLQGSSKNSPMFSHFLHNKHHELFVNLSTGNIIQLPSSHPVINTNLLDVIANNNDNDIAQTKDSQPILLKLSYCVHPTYNQDLINLLPIPNCKDLSNGKPFLNGFIPILSNNLSHWNVVLLILSHIEPIRNFFLLFNSNTNTSSNDNNNLLFTQINLVVKRIWSIYLIRNHITIDSLINCLLNNFNNIYKNVMDPRNLFLWLINKILITNKDLNSILHLSLQGTLKTQRDNNENREGLTHFWQLSLTLPEMSFFKDGRNTNNSLPQIELIDLIKENNFNIVKYPKWLILNFKRFYAGNSDKNVTFLPIKNRNQTIIHFQPTLNLNDIIYKLKINIINDIKVPENILNDDENNWKCQLLINDQNWVEINNKEIIKKDFELLFLKETYLQIWERID